MTPAAEHSHAQRVLRSNGTVDAAVGFELGPRVRSLRKNAGLSLADAAHKAGLARSTLSKIENGQMSPTFDAMRKLARGLGIAMPQLFSPGPAVDAGGTLVTGRAGEGTPLLTPTYEHEMLANDRPHKAMLPYRTIVRARSLEEFDGWVRHAGEEFLLVLTGRIRLYAEHHQPVDMARGDSAYYDAAMGHNVISTSQEDATILWVTSMTGAS